MSTTMMQFRPVAIRAGSTSGDRKSEANRRKSGSSNWWSPIFGWAAEADYIDGEYKKEMEFKPEQDTVAKPLRSRFTEEKAKQLRRLTTETSSYHDIMYHSAIASRLASDFSDRADG